MLYRRRVSASICVATILDLLLAGESPVFAQAFELELTPDSTYTSGCFPPCLCPIEVGQGMSETLQMTDEKRGYCLADRGTYLALR